MLIILPCYIVVFKYPIYHENILLHFRNTSLNPIINIFTFIIKIDVKNNFINLSKSIIFYFYFSKFTSKQFAKKDEW